MGRKTQLSTACPKRLNNIERWESMQSHMCGQPKLVRRISAKFAFLTLLEILLLSFGEKTTLCALMRLGIMVTGTTFLSWTAHMSRSNVDLHQNSKLNADLDHELQ